MSAEQSRAPLAAGARPSSVDGLVLLGQVVEASGDAIFSEDVAGRITSWNAAAERTYGRDAASMLGSSIEQHFPPETADQLREVHQVAVSGRRVERYDAWHVRPDGRRIAVSLTASPLLDDRGVVVGVATTAQDVTERVELAAELERLRLLVEEQNLALTRSNRDLEQFAFVASHDLSEPLRAMSGFAQLLEKRYAPVLDERGQGYLDHIVAGATRMRALIEDLLEYSRFVVIDSPATRVDVGAVARDVVGSLGLTGVRVGDVPDVWFDRGSVQAVLQNLVSNGVKFARPEVPPVVEVTGRLTGGRVLVCVDDNGIGIPVEYRERVFRMFTRLHVREEYSGTGIGLAIVQQVAEQSGGTAWIEDSHLGGTRVCVTLPAPTERSLP